jgi:adenylylsulfate kinase-like enzyme
MTTEAAGVLLISGIPGAGKTTVSRLIAAQLPRSALISGDQVHDLVISGRRYPSEEQLGGDIGQEAGRQMLLRDRNICDLANNLAGAGFLPVIDDVIVYRPRLERLVANIKVRPIYMAMLAPDLDVVEQRDRDRQEKTVFHLWSHLDDLMRQDMTGNGLWIDSTHLTAEQTADAVLARVWQEGVIANA